MKRVKEALYQILEVSQSEERDLSWYFDLVLMILILANVVAIILESVKWIYTPWRGYFELLEVISVIFFTIEYPLRVWTITVDPEYRHPVKGRLRFVFTPLALIDLLAILPFFVRIAGIDMRFIRILRIFRIFRLFKIVRYVAALRILGNVWNNKRAELGISLTFMIFLLLITSCLMYFVEFEAQPETFSSIPATMWWGVATLTTVGYGDVYPITTLGRLLGGAIAIMGVGLFALPAGILAAGCADEISRHRKSMEEAEAPQRFCPHCGERLHS